MKLQALFNQNYDAITVSLFTVVHSGNVCYLATPLNLQFLKFLLQSNFEKIFFKSKRAILKKCRVIDVNKATAVLLIEFLYYKQLIQFDNNRNWSKKIMLAPRKGTS